MSLKTSLAWSLFDRLGYQLVHLVTGLLIARLLSPSDYGKLAMISIFIAVGSAIVESGFGQALIQEKNTTSEHYSSVLILLLAQSVFVYGVLYVLAPSIESFYDSTGVATVLRYMGVSIIFNAVAVPFKSYLTSELQFRKLSLISIITQLFSGIVGVILAYNGFEVFALIFQTLCGSFLRMFFFAFSSYRIIELYSFSITALRNLLSFGGYIVIGQILNTVFANLSSLVIGKQFSPIDLGFFNQGKRIQEMYSVTANQTLQRVFFPYMVKMNKSVGKRDEFYLKSQDFLAIFYLFFLVFLFSFSEDIVVLLLTEKWIESAVYVKIFSVVGLTYPFNALSCSLHKTDGRSKFLLNVDIVKRSAFTLFILWSLFRPSIITILVGRVVSELLGYILVLAKNHRVSLLPVSTLVRPLIVNTVVFWVMAALALWGVSFAEWRMVRVLLGFSFYVLMAYLYVTTFYRDRFVEFVNKLIQNGNS